jgi:hypothetical protein
MNDDAALFPGLRGKPLSDAAMRKYLQQEMGRPSLIVHGFRSTFRDWAAECTNFPREIAEAALAHVLKDKTEAAYQRGDMLERSRAIILLAIAEGAGREGDLVDWHAFQSWLELAEHRVAIPYLKELAQTVPPVAVRLRRDFRAIQKLIEVNAILHQTNRERDEEGRIIANLDDYTEVRNLVADLVAEGTGAGVSDIVRETVEVVRSLEKRCIEGVPLRAIAGTKARQINNQSAGG